MSAQRWHNLKSCNARNTYRLQIMEIETHPMAKYIKLPMLYEHYYTFLLDSDMSKLRTDPVWIEKYKRAALNAVQLALRSVPFVVEVQ